MPLPPRQADFTAFENVRLDLDTEHSKLTASGRLAEGFAPDFKIDAFLASDLAPEFPDITLEATLTPRQASLLLTGVYPFEREPLPIRLQTAFDYTVAPMDVPIEITVSDLAHGEIRLRKNDSGLSGQADFRGQPAAIARLVPALELEAATLAANFAMPEMKTEALTADISLVLEGEPAAQLTGTWQAGRLDFVAHAQPDENAQIRFKGVYDGTVWAELDGSLAGTQGLARFVTLPPEVCSGPISFTGRMTSDLKSWRLETLEASIGDAAYAPYFRDDLIIHVVGTDRHLEGSLYSARLNPGEEVAFFALDAKQQLIKELGIYIDSTLPKVEGYALRVKAEAAGSGPFADPTLAGWFDVEATGEMPAARLAGFFSYRQQNLMIDGLQGETRPWPARRQCPHRPR